MNQDSAQVAQAQAHWTIKSLQGPCWPSSCLCSHSALPHLCYFTLLEVPSSMFPTKSPFPWPRQRLFSLICTEMIVNCYLMISPWPWTRQVHSESQCDDFTCMFHTCACSQHAPHILSTYVVCVNVTFSNKS